MIMNPNNRFTLLNLLLGSLLIILTAFSSASMPSPIYSQQGPESSPQNLSNNPGNSTDSRISVFQNNVYLVWIDDTTGNKDIYFKRSVDNGTTFGSTENLSNNPGNSTSGAQISAIGNNVYVVWQDMVSGNNEIYYRHSNNGSCCY